MQRHHRTGGQGSGHGEESQTKGHLVKAPTTHYGHRMSLFCRTGHFLSISPDGLIESQDEGLHLNSVLEFSSAGIGEVRIRGVASNLYLAMNKSGLLYAEEDPRRSKTIFVESVLGQYNTYLSLKYAHMGWYVGIKKSGQLKAGQRTRWGQKAIQFLPIRTAS